MKSGNFAPTDDVVPLVSDFIKCSGECYTRCLRDIVPPGKVGQLEGRDAVSTMAVKRTAIDGSGVLIDLAALTGDAFTSGVMGCLRPPGRSRRQRFATGPNDSARRHEGRGIDRLEVMTGRRSTR